MEEVKQLVDTLKKHAKFKQLATYSLQSLCKTCSPPSNGWQESVRSAYSYDSVAVVANVLSKNSTDAEIFGLVLSHLQAGAATGLGDIFFRSGVFPSIVASFSEFVAASDLPPCSEAILSGVIAPSGGYKPGPSAAAAGIVEGMGRLLLYLVQHSRVEAAASEELRDCVMALLRQAPSPLVKRIATQALAAIARLPAVLESLAAPKGLDELMTALTEVYAAPNAASESASPVRSPGARPLSSKKPAGSSGRGGPGARSASAWNAHLQPCFEIFDAMSRSDAGVGALRDCAGTMTVFARAVDFAQAQLPEATGALGVRVLARVLGNDLARLVDRLSAATRVAFASADARAVALHFEAEFAAGVLASLALDPALASRLASEGFISRIVGFMRIPPRSEESGEGAVGALDSKVCASLCQTLRRIASHSEEHVVAVHREAGLDALIRLARAPTASTPCLIEALAACGDVIFDASHVAVLDSPPEAAAGSAVKGVDWVVQILDSRGPVEPALAVSCFHVVNAAQGGGYPASSLLDANFQRSALAALTSSAASAAVAVALDLQALGTLAVTACCVNQAAIDGVVAMGGINLAVANLQLAVQSSSAATSGAMDQRRPSVSEDIAASDALTRGGDGRAVRSMTLAGGNAAAEFEEQLGSGDGATATASKSGLPPSVLAAASLQMLSVLCCTPAHTAAAKANGVIREMLAAYTAFGSSGDVYAAFSDLVEAIVTEDEVFAAVRAVASSTAQLRELASDDSLFSIEDKELGAEGIVGAAPTSPTSKGKPKATTSAPGGERITSHSVGVALTEHLCLLETACCSGRLAKALLAVQGPPVLLRCMGIVGMLKSVAGSSGGAANSVTEPGKGRKAIANMGVSSLLSVANSEALPQSIQEEALVRCANTLTGLARLHLDSTWGTAGIDPVPTSVVASTMATASKNSGFRSFFSQLSGSKSGSAIDGGTSLRSRIARGAAPTSAAARRRGIMRALGASVFRILQQDIGRTLLRPVVVKALVRSLNARPMLVAHVAATSITLGALSLGSGIGSPSPVDVVVSHSAVEAITAVMRAHASSAPTLVAAANALGCIAISGRAVDEVSGLLVLPAPDETAGSAAVVTRGSARQVLRELQVAAAASPSEPWRWAGQTGQVMLGALLRLICAVADTSKGAELLRKQGAVSVLLLTLDSSAVQPGEASQAEIAEPSAAGGKAKVGRGGASTFDVTAPKKVDTTPALSELSDGGSAPQQQRLDPEANALVLGCLSRLMDMSDLAEAVKLVRNTAEHASRCTVRAAGTSLCTVALTTILALAGAADRLKDSDSDHRKWADALDAVTLLVSALAEPMPEALKTGSAAADAAATALSPLALRCLTALLRHRPISGGSAPGPDSSGAWIRAGAKLASPVTAVLAAGLGVPKPQLPLVAAVADGVATCAPAVNDALSALQALLDDPTAITAMLKPLAFGGSSVDNSLVTCNPVDLVVACIPKLLDASRMDAVAVALDLLRRICAGDASALASLDPSLLLRALPQLLAAGEGEAVGAALLLLAQHAATSTVVAQQVRPDGLDLAKQALTRFCTLSTDAGEDEAQAQLALLPRGAASVLRGATALLTAVSGCPAPVGAPDASTRQAADLALARRALALTSEDTTLTLSGNARAMTTVCDLITTFVTPTAPLSAAPAPGAVSVEDLAGLVPPTVSGQPSRLVTAEDVDAARAAFLECDARSIIVAAMSQLGGSDPALLKAGSRALAALGGNSAGAATEVRRAVVTLRRACKLRPLPGFISGSGVPVAADASGMNAAAAGGRWTASDVPPAAALSQLDKAARNLAATIAGDASMTPVTLRFVFDSISAFVTTASTVQFLVQQGSVAGVIAITAPSASAQSDDGDGPSARLRSISRIRSQAAATATAASSKSGSGPALPSTNAASSLLRSPSLLRSVSTARSVSRRIRGGTDAATTPLVSESVLSNDDAFALCESLQSAGAQALARLSGVGLAPQRRAFEAASSPTAPSPNAATLAALVSASVEEKVRYGDAGGTASEQVVLQQLPASSGGNALTLQGVLALLRSPLRLFEVIDLLVAVLGHSAVTGAAEHVGAATVPSTRSGGVGPSRELILAPSADVCENAARAAGELFAAVARGTWGQMVPLSSQEPLCSAVNAADLTLELICSAASRGLLQTCVRLLVPLNAVPAAAADALHPDAAPHIAALLSSVVTTLRAGNLVNALATALAPLAGSSEASGPESSGPVFRSDRVAAVHGSVPATVVNIVLQLLAAADAIAVVARPFSARFAADAGASQHDDQKAAVDPFLHAHGFVASMLGPSSVLSTLIDDLQAASSANSAAGCTSAPYSPLWPLLKQLLTPLTASGSAGASGGGLLPLLPPRLASSASTAPAASGTLPVLRITRCLLDALARSVDGPAPPALWDRSQFSLDSPLALRGFSSAQHPLLVSGLLSCARISAGTVFTQGDHDSKGERASDDLSSPTRRKVRLQSRPSLDNVDEGDEDKDGEDEAGDITTALQESPRQRVQSIASPRAAKVSLPRAAPSPLTRGVAGGSTEAEAVAALHRCIVENAVRICGHIDMDGASIAADVVTSPPVTAFFSEALHQPRADVLAVGTVQLLRRVCGLDSPALLLLQQQEKPPAKSPGVAEPSPAAPQEGGGSLMRLVGGGYGVVVNRPRVAALAGAGVIARVILALSHPHASSHAYAREAMRLLRDVSVAIAPPGLPVSGRLLASELGIDEACMKALQSCVKRLGEDGKDAWVLAEGERLLDVLAEVYEGLSGKGFLSALRLALEAVEALNGATSGPAVLRELRALGSMHRVCETLAPDAVPALDAEVVDRIIAALHEQGAANVRIAAVLTQVLARATDNAANAALLAHDAAVETLVEVVMKSHAVAHPFIADQCLVVLRALSVLGADGIALIKVGSTVPLIVSVAKAHAKLMVPPSAQRAFASGSASASAEEDASMGAQASASRTLSPVAAAAALQRTLPAPGASLDAEEKAAIALWAGTAGLYGSPPDNTSAAAADADLEPRVPHAALQCLANIACDQEFEDPAELLASVEGFAGVQQLLEPEASGGTARIIAAGAVDVVRSVMDLHKARPRVMEDALCLLSNLAFTTDGVRLLIGRACAGAIVEALRLFASDAQLFSMALRAVGNLTRCDENIVSVVAFGVIEGIVDGMERNAARASVLQLAADVIGNLASIDEGAIDRMEGLKALAKGLQRRAAATAAAVAAAAGGVGAAGKSGAAAGSLVGSSGSSGGLIEAVGKWLLDDGADRGLVSAMSGHRLNAGLVSACLRSLQYIAEVREQVERMEATVQLAQNTCAVVRCCDFDAQLCVRGALLLAQMLRHTGSPARSAALAAGAPAVLLSVLETQAKNAEVVNTVLRVLLVVGSSSAEVLQAATELSSPLTLLGIAGVACEGVGRTAAQAQEALQLRAAAPSSGPLVDGGGGGDPSERRASAEALEQQLLAYASGDMCAAVLRHAVLLLAQWLAHAPLAVLTAPRLVAFAARLLSSGGSGTPPQAGSVPLAEAVLGLLSVCAAASEDAATALLQAGVMTALRRFAASGPLLDSKPATESVLALLGRLGAPGPDAALEVVAGGGHGVCQAVAAHWALSPRGRGGAGTTAEAASADAKALYAQAGSVCAALLDASQDLRLERALLEARGRLDVAEGGGVAGLALLLAEGGAGATEGGRRNSASSVASSGRARSISSGADGTASSSSGGGGAARRVRALLDEERAWEAAGAALLKDATALARAATAAPGLEPAALLEMRAGRMPWQALPLGVIDALLQPPPTAGAGTAAAAAAAALLRLDVWFVPDAPGGEQQQAARPHKARRMALSLSADLRVLSWRYQSRHYRRELSWRLDLSTVGDVHSGLPWAAVARGGYKRKFFKRTALAARAIVLEPAGDSGDAAPDGAPPPPLLHLEAVNAEQHNSVLRALSLLTQYARARAGVLEPLPRLHVPAKLVLQQPAAAAVQEER